MKTTITTGGISSKALGDVQKIKAITWDLTSQQSKSSGGWSITGTFSDIAGLITNVPAAIAKEFGHGSFGPQAKYTLSIAGKQIAESKSMEGLRTTFENILLIFG